MDTCERRVEVKAMLTIAALVFLSAAAHASAQTGFKNPDGRPNAIAIEPLTLLSWDFRERMGDDG